MGWFTKMMYPLVRGPAVEGVPVTVTCRVLNMARRPCYRWLGDRVSDRAWVQAHQLEPYWMPTRFTRNIGIGC